MLRILMLATALSLASGCATQTFTINGSAGDTPTEDNTQHFFVYGIQQQQITDAADLCGGAENIVKVESHQSFLNGFLGIITWGIYTPRQAKVYCSAETA